MSGRFGDDIIVAIERMGEWATVAHRQVADTSFYEIQHPRYRVVVSVDPARALGLEFFLLDSAGRTELTYSVDTDLYDITKPKYRQFASDIEREIVKVLQALVDGGIRAGALGGRPAMTLPQGDEFVLVTKSRFGTTARPVKPSEMTTLGADLIPV